MKKKIKKAVLMLAAAAVLLGAASFVLWQVFGIVKKASDSVLSLVRLILHTPVKVTATVLLVILLFNAAIMLIVWNWDKRDSFFLLVTRILSAPSKLFYNIRKQRLIRYREEVRELISYVEAFSGGDSDQISKKEFWSFVEQASRQNERLEKNRRRLESKENRVNLGIQVFFLICGVLTALFL